MSEELKKSPATCRRWVLKRIELAKTELANNITAIRQMTTICNDWDAPIILRDNNAKRVYCSPAARKIALGAMTADRFTRPDIVPSVKSVDSSRVTLQTHSADIIGTILANVIN